MSLLVYTSLQCTSLYTSLHIHLSTIHFLQFFECVVVCCSVLQCVAVCCSVSAKRVRSIWYTSLQTHLAYLRCPLLTSFVLQCVAVCCSVLQYVAVCCSMYAKWAGSIWNKSRQTRLTYAKYPLRPASCVLQCVAVFLPNGSDPFSSIHLFKTHLAYYRCQIGMFYKSIFICNSLSACVIISFHVYRSLFMCTHLLSPIRHSPHALFDQRVAACCSVLQCGVVCCSVLQCAAVCCDVSVQTHLAFLRCHVNLLYRSLVICIGLFSCV